MVALSLVLHRYYPQLASAGLEGIPTAHLNCTRQKSFMRNTKRRVRDENRSGEQWRLLGIKLGTTTVNSSQFCCQAHGPFMVEGTRRRDAGQWAKNQRSRGGTRHWVYTCNPKVT